MDSVIHPSTNEVNNNSEQHLIQRLDFLSEILKSDKTPGFAIFKLKQGITLFSVYFCVVQSIFNLWRVILVSAPGVPLFYRVGNLL
jgi:hypothetical protein